MWLTASIGIGIAVIFFAVINALYLGARVGHLTVSEEIEYAGSRLIVFSVLFYALTACVRTYRATRHNVVVNRHRQNALGTFQAFVKAASDDQTKDAVLIKATEAVFAPEPSGYLVKESELRPSASQVLEIFKTGTGKD